jgi:hypothetical protein
MTMAIGPSISRPGSPLPIASGSSQNADSLVYRTKACAREELYEVRVPRPGYGSMAPGGAKIKGRVAEG